MAVHLILLETFLALSMPATVCWTSFRVAYTNTVAFVYLSLWVH